MKRLKKGKYVFYTLDYVDSGLEVAYRATQEPQRVTLRLQLSKPKSFYEVGLPFRIAAMNSGYAGDVAWDPSRTHAELLGLPKDPKKAVEEHDFQLSVSGMAPSFIRIVAATRFGMSLDGTSKVVAMSLVGSARLGASDASIRTSDVRDQLKSPDAYAGRYGALAFPVVQTGSRDGLSVRVRMGKKTTKAMQTALGNRVRAFDLLVSNYPPVKIDGGRAVATLNPAIVRKPTELSFRYATFDVRLVPGTNALLNMLHRFAVEICPIDEVVVAAPW